MGNSNQPDANDMGQISSTLPAGTPRGSPVLFHTTHSDNIQLLGDRRRARRSETFCKGICFSNRVIGVNERIYLRFAEVSTSWSGVLRFGFTSHDPASLHRETLPRYACPDLTNKPGYWAKALPERFAQQNNVLMFYVTRSGDVVFGLNGEEKGVFFSGVGAGQPLWALVDIYGNTTAMEFIDGNQLNNFTSPSGVVNAPPPVDRGIVVEPSHRSVAVVNGDRTPSLVSHAAPTSPAQPLLPVRYHTHLILSHLPFHEVVGRNICLSSDKTIAVRRVDEYCNSYAFTQRPMQLGEKVVIQILSVDRAYTGGLAFGMTACDPAVIRTTELPDDSDLLLDRHEYWVVNKDVCSNPDVGDELSFHLTEEGEIRYGKNGHHVATLMHIDKSLPMWAFFDVYGNTQKIKIVGVAARASILDSGHSTTSLQGSGLTVLLPPPPTPSSRHSLPASLSSTSSPALRVTPPPRPPPPQAGSTNEPNGRTPPTIPPKQPRPVSTASLHHQHRAVSSSPTHPDSSPDVRHQPPVITSYPTPPFQPSAVVGKQPIPPPVIPRRPTMQPMTTRSNVDFERFCESNELSDNASNECSVCFEKPADSVLYMCGHICMCYDCAMDVKGKPNPSCPICRQPVKDVIKIYRS